MARKMKQMFLCSIASDAKDKDDLFIKQGPLKNRLVAVAPSDVIAHFHRISANMIGCDCYGDLSEI